MSWPVAASQSLALLSWLPVIMLLPSGLDARHRTWASCPKGPPMSLPVQGIPTPDFQVCADSEYHLAVGAERHAATGARCSDGEPMGLPVMASQRGDLRSPQPVTMVLPSGLNATDVTRSPCGSGEPTCRPVAYPTGAVLSVLPVSIVLPSG